MIHCRERLIVRSLYFTLAVYDKPFFRPHLACSILPSCSHLLALASLLSVRVVGVICQRGLSGPSIFLFLPRGLGPLPSSFSWPGNVRKILAVSASSRWHQEAWAGRGPAARFARTVTITGHAPKSLPPRSRTLTHRVGVWKAIPTILVVLTLQSIESVWGTAWTTDSRCVWGCIAGHRVIVTRASLGNFH